MNPTEPPSGPPVEAGGTAEPGHRARALAASLLGELTGQRKTGLTFSPLEPTGLAVEPRTARPDEAPSPADERAPAAVPADEAAADAPVTVAEVEQPAEEAVPSLAPGPVPTLERPIEVPRPVEVPRAQTLRPTEPARPGEPALRVVEPVPSPVRPDPVAETPATPSSPVPEPVAEAPRPVAPAAERPAPAAAAPAAAAPTPAAPVSAPTTPVAERPAPTVTSTVTSSANPAATLAQQAPAGAAPARSTEGGSSSGQDVRPAPFAYLAVAQHHTTPARATANGALDQAGQRISSRVDRALVRRAALVTMEAASLLDACDVLDGRARAADATWTGEHHSPTEVREFEGAWGAFYDAQGALAQHVTGS